MSQEHNWPPELDSDAKCYNCGLRYDQWTDPDTLMCHAPHIW